MEYTDKAISEIRAEGELFILAALIDLGRLNGCELSLAPAYLTFDINARIKVSEEHMTEAGFISEYKALIGSLLQNKYTYTDYIQGGLSLLGKNRKLKGIFKAETIEELLEILKEKYAKEYDRIHNKCKLVNRTNDLIIKILLSAVSILFLGLLSYSIYNYLWETRIDNAYIIGLEAYLNKDYPTCINGLETVSIDHLDKDTKAALATSYVKTDNLTSEQKEIVANDLLNTDTEKKYEYWIELGRGQYRNAENIAMQLSDEELLLYSYMKESIALKNDTNIDGEEKAARLNTLQTEIEKMSKKYKTNDQQ